MVFKGRISAVLDGGNSATVTPYGGGVVTVPLAVPFFLLGALPVNTVVVYVMFEDNTGMIIGRMDGYGYVGINTSGVNVYTDGNSVVIEETGGSGNIAARSDGDMVVIESVGAVNFSVYTDEDAIVFDGKKGG